MKMYTPDTIWETLEEMVREAALETFPVKKKKGPEFEAHKKDRADLLQKRAEYKNQMYEEDNYTQASLELAMVTARLGRRRKAENRRRQAGLVEEARLAWNTRNMAELHRARVSLACNGKGQKKRNYKTFMVGN